MTFEVISERFLNPDELEVLNEAERLLWRGYDRRALLKMVGMAGVVFAAPIAGSQPAHALVPLWIKAVQVVGSIIIRNIIPATIVVANTKAAAQSGPVTFQHREPSGLVVQQASGYANVAARSEQTMRHSGFRAKTVGTNVFEAEAENSESDDFEVTD
jgi:hypothetical protein